MLNQPAAGGDTHTTPFMGSWSGNSPVVPERLGRYRVLRKLGGGGMGAVYLVENTELQREEALKVPHFDSGDGPAIRERFLREARSAAQAGPSEPVPDPRCRRDRRRLLPDHAPPPGNPLSAYTGKPYPPREAVKIVAKLAQALDHAHGKGVIHRDLKPSNIMMCPETGPTVMDFGLAKQTMQTDQKLTQSGVTLGTPAYMPPEQVKGDLDRIGPASDIYSLGVILFELLTGRLPFEGSMGEVLAKVIFLEAPLPSQVLSSLNPALDGPCLKAMAKSPEDRYPSMKAFLADLIDLLRILPATADTDTLLGEQPESIDPSLSFHVSTVNPEKGPGSANLRGSKIALPAPVSVPPTLVVPPPTAPMPAAPTAGDIKNTTPLRKSAAVHVTPVAPRVPVAPPSPPARGRRFGVWIVLALIVAVGSAGAWFFLGGQRNDSRTRHAGDKSDKRGTKESKREEADDPNLFVNSFGMKLAPIPGGKLRMGSPKNESGRSEDEDQHEVEVSAFSLGVYAVTQKQFRAVMGYNPSYFSTNFSSKEGIDYGKDAPGHGKSRVPEGEDTEDYPVENVSWPEAVEFCQKLTEQDKKKPAGQEYRLPTEAEWELACRGGARFLRGLLVWQFTLGHSSQFQRKRSLRRRREGPTTESRLPSR